MSRELYKIENQKNTSELSERLTFLQTEEGKEEYKKFIIEELKKDNNVESELEINIEIYYIEQISVLESILEQRKSIEDFSPVFNHINNNGFMYLNTSNRIILIINVSNIKDYKKLEWKQVFYDKSKKIFGIEINKGFVKFEYDILDLFKKSQNLYLLVANTETESDLKSLKDIIEINNDISLIKENIEDILFLKKISLFEDNN